MLLYREAPDLCECSFANIISNANENISRKFVGWSTGLSSSIGRPQNPHVSAPNSVIPGVSAASIVLGQPLTGANATEEATAIGRVMTVTIPHPIRTPKSVPVRAV